MAVDSMRISQALPTVKCSKCSATISLDDMSMHVCRSMAGQMASIAEQAPDVREDRYRRYDPEPRRPYEKQSYGGQTERRAQWEERRIPAFVEPRTQYPVERPQFPSTANASAVLGKIHNIKTGVLDSDGMRRPQQAQRFGPVQTRDPRATMIPIRTQLPERNGRTEQAQGRHHREHHDQRHDDNMSIISERSNKSQQSNRSLPKSAGRIMAQDEQLLSTSLSSNDSGPFAHVGTKLDPAIFIPADIPMVSGKQKSGKTRKGPRPTDFYDEEWENGGIDDDRPSTAASLGRSIHSSSSTSSLARNQMPAPRHRHQEYSRPEQQPEQRQNSRQKPSSHAARPDPEIKRAVEKYARPVDRQRTERVAPTRYEFLKPEPPVSKIVAPVASRTHARNETSSSMGTVLTNASMLSARSSVSSPPTSEVNYHAREDFSRSNLHTPTPGHDNQLDVTPIQAMYTTKPQPPVTVTTTKGAAAAGLPRSQTTGSFDRLLQDIGASIDQLAIPAAPFAASSPSSTYSPVLPASQFASPAQPASHPPIVVETKSNVVVAADPLARLGSPASLQSKTTIASSEKKSRHACMACNEAIVGKSVFSADGKLPGRYHKSCFVCTTCRNPFPDGDFYVWRQRPYCAQHYHKSAGSLCAKCGEGIEGECLATPDDRRYHVHCHSARPAQGRQYERF